MNAFEMKGLTKNYKDFQLGPVNLTLPMGCIMGLIGENGAGKSTTIKLLMNAIHRDDGEILIFGKDNRTDFQEIKQDIGVVLDEACFPEGITVSQVNHIMKYTYKNWNEAQFLDYMQRFSLPLKKSFKEFSRGMKMKLAIGVAMSHGARLLVLDEATSGLDPIVRDEILDIFYEFTRDEQHSILISSHIVSDLEKLCDYIAFIHKGRLIFSEEKDRLLEEYGILRISKDEFSQIDPDAVYGSRSSGYGVEALVKRDRVPRHMAVEKVSIEDLIVYMAKGENKR